MQRDIEVLVNFDGEVVRPAREGELELLGRPRTVSPARLLKACHAYAGNVETTPDLEDLTAEAYMFKMGMVRETDLP